MAKKSKAAVNLSRKIRSREACVAVIGLGYVGLPLACVFARKGFRVVGLDRDSGRIEQLAKGQSHIADVPHKEIKRLIKRKRFSATTSPEALRTADIIVICVPTPLNKIQDPDLSYILQARDDIRRFIKPGQLIILESTTYPGTTEELILPEFEKSGLKAGKDFFLCFSPERIDPGNSKFHAGDIPKVVGGITEMCTWLGVLFYSSAIHQVVPVSSTRSAEMTKLLENTFRIVNIGLVNELAMAAEALGIDIWEVIEAASTKPFGFMPFFPGPGVGGHCIGIDPVYLSWKAKHHGKSIQFIELARTVNLHMPDYMVERIFHLLNAKAKRGIHGSRILVLGVAYKADVSDVRESPALEILARLKRAGAQVSYHDPYVAQLEHEGEKWESKKMTASILRAQHLVVILTNHSVFNWGLVAREAKLIFDTRNSLKDFKQSHISRL